MTLTSKFLNEQELQEENNESIYNKVIVLWNACF